MPFNEPLDTTQNDAIAAGGLQTRDYLLITPVVILFQARPAVDSSADVLFEIPYDSVASGSYTDLRRDQVVMITAGTTTADFQRPLWRGRLSRLPTSDTLFIGEASIALDTALYITVFDAYEPAQRLRSGALIDGILTFEKLCPAIKGLSSTYLKEPIAGEASFALSPVAQPMEEGATVNDATGWLWSIPGATYTGGTAATDREVEFDLPAGHVWATVQVTDSNGTVGDFVFEIYVVDRYDPTFIFAGNNGVDITNDIEGGINGSVEFFDGADEVLDRWRITVVNFEVFRDGTIDPFPNIVLVGYLRQEDNSTQADQTYGALKTKTYTIAGFASLAGEIKLSPLAISDVSPAAAWDDMALPNPARVIAHLTSRYATLARLCCIDYGTLNSNDWYGGNRDVESPYLLDACNAAADEINAQLVFAADGQIILRRNLNFESDAVRNAADVITTLTTGQMTVIGYTHPHMPQLAQLQVGCRSYRTADGSSIGITATAPAVAFAEGADFDEARNQLLVANAGTTAAKLEAGERAGNLLAYRDDGDEWTFELSGSYRFAQPSIHQWWQALVDPTEIANGLGLTAADRLLLKSISHKFNPERGTRTVSATFKHETRGGLTMILVEVIPDIVPTVMPPRPPMSAYLGAFAPRSTINSTSSAPARKPPRGYAYAMTPYSPQQQADIEDAMPRTGCRVQRPPVNFRNSADVVTPFTLQLGQNYDIFVKGSAKIADDTATVPATTENGGNGYDTLLDVITGDNVVIDCDSGDTWDGGEGQFNADGSPGRFDAGAYAPAVELFSMIYRVGTTGAWTKAGLSAAFTAVTSGRLYLMCNDVPAAYGDNSGFITAAVSGLSASGEIFGDAFYQWREDGAAQLYDSNRGLRLNSTAVVVPPDFNDQHQYQLQYIGEGNPLPLRFQTDDYAAVENALLKMLFCGPGA